MDRPQRSAARLARSYVLETSAAVAFCYFVLGGAGWSPWVWAAFCVLAVSVVVVNVHRDTGQTSEAEYSAWHARFGFAMVVALLGAAAWHRSLWLLGLGLLLGWFWIDGPKGLTQGVRTTIRIGSVVRRRLLRNCPLGDLAGREIDEPKSQVGGPLT
jgi:hypothetical protein